MCAWASAGWWKEGNCVPGMGTLRVDSENGHQELLGQRGRRGAGVGGHIYHRMTLEVSLVEPQYSAIMCS